LTPVRFSIILGKLGIETRREAAARARQERFV
jgi:hypothetical protein